MHTFKKEKETKKIKDPLLYFSPSSNDPSTTKTTPKLQALEKRPVQEWNSAQKPLSLDQRS
jgi:hypothetical protein